MKFRKTILDNGLTVATDYSQDHKGLVVEWILRDGARHEAVHGAAHYLEHLIANSPVAAGGKEVAERFKEVSLNSNFTTGYDHINAYVHTLPRFAQEVIAALGRTVGRTSWTARISGRERSRILKEYEFAQEQPYKMCDLKGLMLAYPQHEVAHFILGSRESINAMTDQDMHVYMQDHFHGQRMAVVVSGALEHEKVLRMVRESFSGIPRGTPREESPAPVFQGMQKYHFPKQDGVQSVLVRYEGSGQTADNWKAGYAMMYLYQHGLNEVLRKAGAAYMGQGGFVSAFPEFGENVISLRGAAEEMQGLLDTALHVAEQPETWLTREKCDEVLLKEELVRAFNDSDIRETNSTMAWDFVLNGTIRPAEEIDAYYTSQLSYEKIRGAYENWNRNVFNIVAFGPMTDAPSPQKLLDLRARRPAPKPA